MKHPPSRLKPTLAAAIIRRFVLYATLPVVIGGGITILLFTRKNISDVRERNLLRARTAVQLIRNGLREPQLVLKTMAVAVREASEGKIPFQMDSLLMAACVENPLLNSLCVLTDSGLVSAAGFSGEEYRQEVGADLSGRHFFRHACSTETMVWLTDVDSSGAGMHSISYVLNSGGNILAGNCSFDILFRQIDSIAKDDGYLIAILDRKGNPLFCSETLRFRCTEDGRSFMAVAREHFIRDTTFSFTVKKVNYIGSVVPVAVTGWKVLVAQEEAAAYTSVWQLTGFFVAILGIFGILSAGGGGFLARWLSRLFAYLSHNARRIAEGDYNAPMPDQRHHELESLAENIRSMVTAVREREEQYRELNQETRRNLLFQRTLLEAISIPVVYFNLHGDILGCNSMFESAMGVSREKIQDISSPEKAPETLRLFMEGLKKSSGTGARAFEQAVLFRDGTEHTVIIHRAPYYLEEGSVDGYICALLDITEHRLTEDAFQRLIQSTVGVHGVDFFHRIVRLLCKWIGCDGALIGELTSPAECRVFSMLLNNMRVDEYTFSLENSPAGKTIREGFISIEDDVCKIFPDDPELKRLSVRGYAAVPLEADDGTTLGILALFSRSPLQLPLMARASMEILAAIAASEVLRMRAERERVKLESQLRQVEKMEAIGQLAGGIAHDINNQLGCILGYADIIQDVNEEPSIREFITKISQSVSRSSDLVKKLLAFSRHGNFVMKPVNVTALIHEVVGFLQHSIDKSVALSMVAADGQLFVMGDPSQLQNALLNLGLNARDAMPDGGTITYEVHSMKVGRREHKRFPACVPGDYVCIRVRDTGVGMPPEIIDRIYEPFFTTKAEGKGTGLGLAAVYGTVSSHRGGIDVKSRVGKGTDFTILLPYYAPPVDEADEAGEQQVVFGSGTVLVIDDEIDIRDTVTMTLRKCGYTVITAGDGLEGVQLYIKFSGMIDLVILDMVLPGIDGKSTFERLQEIDPQVKVVVVSGYSVDGRIQSVLDQGARSFLQKPFRGADLLRLVSDILGGKT